MARGSTLSSLVSMLKAEIGYSLTTGVATAEDARLKVLLSNTQKWLAADFEWPFLKRTGDVALSSGDRTATLPSTLDPERPFQVYARDSEIWRPLEHGITPMDFAVWDSDEDETSDPIRKWQYATDTTFEVWPVPASDTTVRFTGVKKLAALAVDADTADLDDLLIVLFTAAELLAGQEQKDAGAKLARAQGRYSQLKANYPKVLQGFVLGGNPRRECDRGSTVSGGGTVVHTISGTTGLVDGETTGSVVYNFGEAPVAVILTVQAPAGGLTLVASLDGAATSSGFDFALTGAPDSSDYVLHWEATLP
jgi:hypothetical protein